MLDIQKKIQNASSDVPTDAVNISVLQKLSTPDEKLGDLPPKSVDRRDGEVVSVKPKEKPKKRKRIFVSLIPSEEKEYFVENFSMLLSSGMDIMMALESIKDELRSSQMKAIISNLQEDVESGLPIWQALEKTGFFPVFIVSLIKIGERSGSLVKNLQVIALQQKKDRSFNAKIQSAMMYPIFVLTLTLIVGVGIAWFILPKLTLVFDQLKVDLPLITKILIAFGKFIQSYGNIAVPAFLGIFGLVIFFVFIFSRTKFIGQTLLFSFPGIKGLIQQTELARMGYIMGTLLRAGLPVVDTLRSLEEASTFFKYKNLYAFLKESIEEGNTFERSFDRYPKSRKLVPSTVQQMIIVGEKSGHLSKTFLMIGETFEEKVDNTTKNLSTILEPVLLVIVWLGVVAVALAVILPIYSLIGGLNQPKDQITGSSEPVIEMTTTSTESGEEENVSSDEKTSVDGTSEAVPVASVADQKSLKIQETGTGFLNVRDKSDVKGNIVGKVLPGEQYTYKNEQNGWYEIALSDGTIGWVIGDYVELINK